MADIISPERRSALMSRIRSKDTKIELEVRRGLHALGFRYRLGGAGLPGKPDIVLPKYRTVVFVHGCFWHQHDCHLFRWPATRQEFWREKIGRNVVNDERSTQALRDAGWRVATVWECALKGRTRPDFGDAMQRLAAWIQTGEQTITIRGG